MKTRCVVFCILATFLSTLPLSAQCNSYECPPCLSPANGLGPMPGHGVSSDGRRIYNVFIDGSWGTPTNATIWNATNQAINQWNAASDPSCNNGPGTQTAYYFSLNQAGGSGAADVIIKQVYDPSQCAGTIPGSLPRVVELDPALAGVTQSQAAQFIEHELGHVIGLADAYDTACSGYPSIMDTAGRADCTPESVETIYASDVGQSNRALNLPQTCAGEGTGLPMANPCPSNNGCSGYDQNGYAIMNPDFCTYASGCQSGWQLGAEGNGSCCEWASSPIIIDVAGDGFELTDAKDGVMFDLSNSGKKQLFSWTAAGVQNGWLALDRNGDGTIDSGAELFGNFTPQPPSSHPNGYLALAVYDLPENGGNGNGEIDPGDQIYGSLLIWIDLNHNGTSELHHLADLGIDAIGLDYQLSNWTDQYGNVFRYKGRIKIANKPGDHWAYDVLLQMAH